MKYPLEGIKVVELARVLAGPWVGQVLSDLGAEVIKIESPEGDETRKWGPPFVQGESGDLDSIESMFHDDVSMTDHGNGMTSDGVEANMNDVRNWKNTFSDMNLSAVRHIESGNTVVTEMRMQGTNTGEMEMPDGSKLPATGKKVDFQGVQVVEFKDGKMYKGSQYYNPMVMMEQLGLMPS